MTAKMTDTDRAILNRLLAQDESDLTVDDLLQLPAGAVSMICLLVESQKELQELRLKYSKLMDKYCNARKGGK